MDCDVPDARTPLEAFTGDQLATRLRKARDLHKKLDSKPEDTWSAYQLHILPEVLGYLDLVAHEVDLELAIRNLPTKRDLLCDELSALLKASVRGLCANGKFNFEERIRVRCELRNLETSLPENPKLLEEVRNKLAAISSQEINDYMDELWVNKHDSLRPPLFDREPGGHPDKKKRRQFELFAAKWWNERPEIQRRKLKLSHDEVPETALMQFAKECDDKRFNPNGTIFPDSVYNSIRTWNLMKNQAHPIVKFEDLIFHFGTRQRDRAIAKRENPEITKLRDLYPLRKFLSTNATRLARTLKNDGKK